MRAGRVSEYVDDLDVVLWRGGGEYVGAEQSKYV